MWQGFLYVHLILTNSIYLFIFFSRKGVDLSQGGYRKKHFMRQITVLKMALKPYEILCFNISKLVSWSAIDFKILFYFCFLSIYGTDFLLCSTNGHWIPMKSVEIETKYKLCSVELLTCHILEPFHFQSDQ